MKLIKCHVENFGKLSGFDYNFNDGLNLISGENGFGKSTFAAFLKAMFFGFGNERSRDDIANERKRYTPWQGGVFGGNIVFKINSKEYFMERIWGKKDADDIFKLYDNKTMVECDDYNSDIGVKLFGVNGESFVKTAFIAQNDCKTSSNTEINARIGNVSVLKDDLGNYDRAEKLLKDIVNSKSPTRKTGSANKIKSAITKLREEAKSTDNFENARKELVSKTEEKKKKNDELRAKQKILMAEQKKLSESAAAIQKLENYKSLCDSLHDRKKAYEDAISSFNGHIPSEKEIVQSEKELNEYNMLGKRLEELRLTDDEQMKYDVLAAEFKNGVPTDDEINDMLVACGQRDAAEKRKKELEAETEALENAGPAGKSMKIPLIAAGIILIAASLTAFLVLKGAVRYVTLLLSAAGILLIISGTGKKKGDDSRDNEIEQKKSEIIRYQNDISDKNLKLDIFMSKISTKMDASEASFKIIRTQAAEFMRLENRKNESQDKETTTRMENAGAVLREFADTYNNGIPVTGHALSEIRKKLRDMEHAGKEYENAEAIRIEFENNNDIEALRSLIGTSDRTLDDVNEELTVINSEIDENSRIISDYMRQTDDLSEKLDELTDKKAEIEQLNARLKEEKHDYDISKSAWEFLEKAKNSFTSKYTAPVLSGFKKYYNILTGLETEAENYKLDANIELTYKEDGLMRKTAALSTGLGDATGICFRMALTDAVYKSEKPFLLLDDPFVNLDSDKKKLSRAFLDSISSEYQVIYMTCD